MELQRRGNTIGITIHYRGKVADLARIEDLEDRVLDLSLDLGGQAQVWRSSGDADPARIVRGLILNHAPGQESMSLLISPEGWLIGMMEIEDAEAGRLTEPPWCFVKTQFGSVEAHVALIEILAALKHEFIPDLEVSDEGGYWEKRDIQLLAKNFGTLRRAIDGLAEGLRHHGLSAEAAEDPEILIQRITRIAEKVRRSLGRASEDDDDEPLSESERLALGLAPSPASESDKDGDQREDWLPDRDEHPLLERASQLYLRMHELFKDAPPGEQGAMHALFQGAGDLCGGLAQAMSPRIKFIDDRGLRIVQLKRALRGAAFARGALYNVDKAMVPKDVSKTLDATLEEIEEEMFAELGRLRESL